MPCRLFLWPDGRSYTGQPVAELHTLGSPPLLIAALNSRARRGAARPARRVHAAGVSRRADRPDPGRSRLGRDRRRRSAPVGRRPWRQLAGGLARPLHQLRDDLLELLAHLEAGFDFADEDLPFITADDCKSRSPVRWKTIARLAAADGVARRGPRRGSGGARRTAERRQEQPLQRPESAAAACAGLRSARHHPRLSHGGTRFRRRQMPFDRHRRPEIRRTDIPVCRSRRTDIPVCRNCSTAAPGCGGMPGQTRMSVLLQRIFRPLTCRTIFRRRTTRAGPRAAIVH